MKIIAINGSPRKGWNSAKLLEKWKEGILSVIPDAEVKEVNLNDLKFTECRSCFSCKLKGGKFFINCNICHTPFLSEYIQLNFCLTHLKLGV